MFHYAVALVQLLVAYYSCDFESDHGRPENDQSQSAFHGDSSGSIMRHIPVFDINMVAGAGEPPTRRTRRGDVMDVVMEEDDMDMDLENLDTATPAPTPAMPTTSPITIPTITTSMMKAANDDWTRNCWTSRSHTTERRLDGGSGSFAWSAGSAQLTGDSVSYLVMQNEAKSCWTTSLRRSLAWTRSCSRSCWCGWRASSWRHFFEVRRTEASRVGEA